MARRGLAGFAFGMLLAGAPACDETGKQCFDGGGPVKVMLSACGELCDKGDAKACDRQMDLAEQHCLKGTDKEVCAWMCMFTKTGKDLYCKREGEL